MEHNPYKTLQLPETATYEQIKQRYRHLSKLIHPDKQPLENYQMAQIHFKKIDEAYKAISSRLRRYVYRKYGQAGINLLEMGAFYFKQFEDADLSDPKVLNELDQLLKYFMYEEHAGTQVDKSKLRNRTICLMFKPFNQVDKLPRVEREEFQFETSLPDCFGLSNSFKILHVSEALSGSTKSELSFAIGSSLRYKQNWLINFNTSISKDNYNFDTSIDRIISPNLILHFIPLQVSSEGMELPQFGFDASLQNYFVSAITDFNNYTLQIGSSPAIKEVSKMIKIGFEDSNFLISPQYERQVTENIKIFTQLQLRTQMVDKSLTDINYAITYGYKIKLAEQLKLELMSLIGPQNYLQISIFTPKFRVNIPIFINNSFIKLELSKIAVFIGTYIIIEAFKNYQDNAKTNRQRLQYQNYNRLSVEKTAILKEINAAMAKAEESQQREKKDNGLIICLAYMAAPKKTQKIFNKLKKALPNKNRYAQFCEELEEEIKKIKEQISTSVDNFNEEAYEISHILQSHVKGSQIFKLNLHELSINPCLNEHSEYNVIIVYWQNGVINQMIKKGTEQIQIGGMKKNYQKGVMRRIGEKFLSYLCH